MTVLVGAETILLVLVLMLVAGLLRSNAEILRRLGPPVDGLPEPPQDARLPPGVPAPAVGGTTPDGDAIGLAFDGAGSAPTLLAFLTSGCSSCAGFWETLRGDA